MSPASEMVSKDLTKSSGNSLIMKIFIN
jgi:hypothetical protein